MTVAQSLIGLLVERSDLHVPPDAEAQRDAWGANCAPIAMAAILGTCVADLREPVEQVTGKSPYRGYMTASNVVDCLRMLGRHVRVQHPVSGLEPVWPRGKAVIALDIICTKSKRPRFIGGHAVASVDAGLLIFDCNAGVWLPREIWEAGHIRETAARMGGDSWRVSAAIEVLS